YPEGNCGNAQSGTPIKDIVELVGPILIDFTRGAEALTASMAAISVQDDANVARQRSPLELTQESALVNPVQKLQQLWAGSAFAAGLSLSTRLAEIDLASAGRWIDLECGSIWLGAFEN